MGRYKLGSPEAMRFEPSLDPPEYWNPPGNEDEQQEEISAENQTRIANAIKCGWWRINTGSSHSFFKGSEITPCRPTLQEALDDVEKLTQTLT